MTVRDTMRRHPAGKALPGQKALLARSAAREHALEGTVGVVLSLVIPVFAVTGYLSDGLPVWLRLLMLVPIALLPLALLQAVHGLTDAKRLLDWARYFDQEVETTTTNRRSNK
jgi:hypothetical protein